MTYIQKKRIKLILLGIAVLALWIYLLGAMTSHAAWVNIGAKPEPNIHIESFHYDDQSISYDKPTRTVTLTLKAQYDKGGGRFIFGDILAKAAPADKSRIEGYIAAFDHTQCIIKFDLNGNRFKIVQTSLINKSGAIMGTDDTPNSPWQSIPPGDPGELVIKILKEKYNF